MATDWSRYGPCMVCGAERGKPCFDLRQRRNPYRQRYTTVATPHKQRFFVGDHEIRLPISPEELRGLLRLVPDQSRFILAKIEPIAKSELLGRMYEVHIKIELEMDLHGLHVQKYLDLLEGKDDDHA